jgi:conjugative transfer signal peptidase TraF
VLVLVFAAALLLGDRLGLRINLTRSIPIGLYQQIDAPIARGALVEACLPQDIATLGRKRGYLRGGSCPDGTEPVGKTVAAVTGDTVELTDQALIVNATKLPDSATLDIDREGRAMHKFPRGTYAVAADEVWLVATSNPRSWDSRYYGPIPLENIRSAVRPLVTLQGF